MKCSHSIFEQFLALDKQGQRFRCQVGRPESNLGTAGRYDRKPLLRSLVEGGKCYRMLAVTRPLRVQELTVSAKSGLNKRVQDEAA